MFSAYSALNEQFSSIQELKAKVTEERQKSQYLRNECAKNCQRLQQFQAKLTKSYHKSRQLSADCAKILQESQQVRFGLNRNFQKSVQLHFDSDSQKPVVQKLRANSNKNFLDIVQSRVDLDVQMEMLQEVQSDVSARLAVLEELQSNLDKHLDKVKDLITNSQSFALASDACSEFTDEAEVKRSVESIHALINQFVTGDWSKHHELDASRTQRVRLAALNFHQLTICTLRKMNPFTQLDE